ncbi:MAG: type III-A CRISPR-associated protein Csm2 [Bacteroidota bacterium]
MDTHEYLKSFFGGKSFDDLLGMAASSDPNEVLLLSSGISKMVKDQGKELTSTQLRQLLNEVKNDDFAANRADLARALPKLVYMEARQDKRNAQNVISFIRHLAGSTAISTNENSYTAFKDILNSVVAYHKLHH